MAEVPVLPSPAALVLLLLRVRPVAPVVLPAGAAASVARGPAAAMRLPLLPPALLTARVLPPVIGPATLMGEVLPLLLMVLVLLVRAWVR